MSKYIEVEDCGISNVHVVVCSDGKESKSCILMEVGDQEVLLQEDELRVMLSEIVKYNKYTR